MFDGTSTIADLDRANARVGSAHRELLRGIHAVAHAAAWRDEGARDLPHWLSMRYGVSLWKAHRWVRAADVLEDLPRLSQALSTGELGLDKVVELARFAREDSERGLITWAKGVSCGAVRRRAERDAHPEIEIDREAHRQRTFRWWWLEDERRLGLEGELPAAEGKLVISAIERVAATIPEMPDEEGLWHRDRRRADALVALCSAKVAADPDPARATVVVHAQAEGLARGSGGAELDDGPTLHPETVKRLLCTARVLTVAEGVNADPIAFGRTRREPSLAQIRQVRYRDRGCVFPGCGTRAFTEVHHVRFWNRGGTTDLNNLALICSFHHRLVHESGWWFTRDPGGGFRWFRPSGVPYRAGPAPPEALAAVV
jgi:hypothetical protein